MRPVYASRLTISPAPDDGADADATPDAAGVFDHAIALLHDWLVESAGAAGADVTATATESFRADDAVGLLAAEADHLISGEDRAWRGATEQPAPNRPRARLQTELHLRPSAAGACLTLRLLSDAPSEGNVPPSVRFAPPPAIPLLLAAFAVAAGTVPVSLRPWKCGAAGLDRLVRDLTDPRREIPIVVVSTRSDDRPIVDVARTAQHLAGLARVVRLADFQTAFGLTDRVDKPLACYDGAVRVYWPGFSLADDPFAHPLWTALTLSSSGLIDELPGLLLRRLGAAAAERIGPDRDVLALARAVERERAAAAKQARPAPQAADPETADLLALAWEEIAQLKARIDDLERENGDLLETIARGFSWQDAFARSGAGVVGNPAEERRASPDQIDGLATLTDAVRLAADVHAGPHIEFAESAFKSAAKSSYQLPPQAAYAALTAICTVAVRYHDGSLDTTFADAFKELGQDYRGNVSPTALGHYPNHYTFATSMGQVQVGPHLALGRGNPRNSLRLYWYVDDDARRFYLCHVGEHLPDTTT